jgi:outer membrane protein assembly factor BamB
MAEKLKKNEHSLRKQRLKEESILKGRFCLLIAILSLTYLVTANAQTYGINWPMFRHDPLHSGYTNSTAPNTNNLLWKYPVGSAVYSSPSISDGRVYVGGEKGNFYCLDALTGAKIWEYYTGLWSSPAVSGNRVYFGSNQDNKIYSLNAVDGKPIWSYTTGASIGSSPAIDGGRLYIGAYDSDRFYCLDASTGQKNWNHTTIGQVWSSPSVAYGYVFVGDLQGFTVYCLDAVTGSNIWNYKTARA